MDLLKLVALDDEDLAVVSAHLQDAVLNAGDIVFLPREKRFALLARRCDWRSADKTRLLTGLHFECVLDARFKGIDRNDPGRALDLLAIDFQATEAPSGDVTLFFKGDAAIRLTVECLEALMQDIDPRASDAAPHETADADPA